MKTTATQSEASSASLLKPHEAAQLLRVSDTTLRRLVQRGALPAYRIASALRFDRADLDRFLRRGRIDLAPSSHAGLQE